MHIQRWRGQKRRDLKDNRGEGKYNFPLNGMGHSPECTHVDCVFQSQEETMWATCRRTTSRIACTCGCMPCNAVSTAAKVDLMASKGFEAGVKRDRGSNSWTPASSSRIICNIDRPRSCDCNSSLLSNRRMSSPRLLQSSCNSHLQYISMRGRSCMEAARSEWWEGVRPVANRRHRSCPEQRQKGRRCENQCRILKNHGPATKEQ